MGEYNMGEYIDAKMFIDGTWSDGVSALNVTDPATGGAIGSVAYGDASHAYAACEAAVSAFPAWRGTTGRQRSRVLARAADLLSGEAERIGQVLSRESGKRLQEAVGEVHASAEYFRWFSERARDPMGYLLATDVEGRRSFTVEVPVGVAAVLTPWNFPISIQARKIAAALAAGCSVVSRASEKAPLAVCEMFEVLRRAGLPDGVANLVHGPAREITSEFLRHEAVRAVSFTGSTQVGRSIMAAAGERIVKPALELGGNAPFIVFQDADIERAVDGAMIAKFRNNGQSCIGANRFYVHDDVYGEFVEKFSRRISEMTVGVPYGELDVDLGPLIDSSRVSEVQTVIDEAVRLGGEVLTSDAGVPADGTYCPPALVGNVPSAARLASEEVFGPAAGVFPFGELDEVLSAANDTEMGLAAYAYTSQSTYIKSLVSQLDAGVIGLNTPVPSTPSAPMGGLKQSGLGREGGHLGIHDFLECKYIAVE